MGIIKEKSNFFPTEMEVTPSHQKRKFSLTASYQRVTISNDKMWLTNIWHLANIHIAQ